MNQSVEYTVTLEATINGNKAWIKTGHHSEVGPDETPKEAYGRVVALVNDNIMNNIEATAKTVIAYEEKS